MTYATCERPRCTGPATVCCSTTPGYAFRRVEVRDLAEDGFVAVHTLLRPIQRRSVGYRTDLLSRPRMRVQLADGCFVESDDFRSALRALSRIGVPHQPAWDAATAFVREERRRIEAVANALVRHRRLDSAQVLAITQAVARGWSIPLQRPASASACCASAGRGQSAGGKIQQPTAGGG